MDLREYAKIRPLRMVTLVFLYAIGAFSFPIKQIAEFFGGSYAALFISGGIVRTLVSVFPVYLVFKLKMQKQFAFSSLTLSALWTLPAFLVAFDNFPIVSQITGYMSINVGFFDAICLAFYCLSVGVAEELIFRGLIFPLLIIKFGESKKGVFFAVISSSALFGAAHLINLTGGFSLGVFLQAGYSFLIGCVCAVAMICGGNIFFPIAVHTLFDFGGFLPDYFGSGRLWTYESVVFTVVLSLLCAAAVTAAFFKVDGGKFFEDLGLKKQL